MRDFVLLYVNGRRHELRGQQVFRPLSEFLRNSLRLTGTKVACAEGDCGACTVLIGRPRAGRIDYRPVTSCIQYVAQLDGTHVVTVEGVGEGGNITPLQQALIENHASQCGYCTPGIVLSLCALLDRTPSPSRHDVCRALVGNLCRCTGYDSIINAIPSVKGTAWRNTNDRYPDRWMLADLEHAAAEPVELADSGRRLFKPATLDEAIHLRSLQPEAVVLAGGTDLGVIWNKGQRGINTFLCISHLPEINECVVRDNTWSIGAATTIAEIQKVAATVLPSYSRLLERFGSPPIQSVATLGGNLANGSPIGDSMPALLVLEAEVQLVGPNGTRRVNLNDFYTGYRRTVLRADELIARVSVPLPRRDELFGAYKISKRRDLDISTFTAALWMNVEGDIIRAARIACGGVAPTLVRLRRTESWLSERPFSENTLRHAGAMAREEIAPISDVRGSTEYRLLLAENIFVKFAREAIAGWMAPAGDT
jgi:xanthine dehydrogenase small subunit